MCMPTIFTKEGKGVSYKTHLFKTGCQKDGMFGRRILLVSLEKSHLTQKAHNIVN